MRIILLIVLAAFACGCIAQVDSLARTDSAKVVKTKIYSGPRRASVLSAVFPGAGQAYNRKFWKIPIIYAGLGGLGYMFYVNQDNFSYFRRNLIAIHDDDENTQNVTPYSSAQLVILKKEYGRYRDFAGFGLVLLYLINIVDANVDAHLKTFDVSDELGLQLQPMPLLTPQSTLAAGLKLTIKFK